MGGDTAGEDEARRVISRELGSLRRGAGLTEDALRDATALLALDAVKRTATARRVEAWYVAGLLAQVFHGVRELTARLK